MASQSTVLLVCQQTSTWLSQVCFIHSKRGVNADASKLEPKSKRVPVRLRHKIEKASAAKGRKARKLAKAVSSLYLFLLPQTRIKHL